LWGLDGTRTGAETVTGLNYLFKWCLRTPKLSKVIFPYGVKFKVQAKTGLKYHNTGDDVNLGEYAWSVIMDNLNSLDIDFNYCTIEQLGNPYMRSPIIEAEDMVNCYVSNLNLLGDRITHDYSFIGANGSDIHEFGHGISLLGACINDTFENVEIKRVTGYGFGAYQLHAKGIPNGDLSIPPSVRLGNIQEGDIDETGNDIADVNKTRSELIQLRQVDIDSPTLYTNGWGLYSARGIDPGIEIKIYFYNAAGNLLNVQYSDEGGRLTNVEGATQIRMVFDQPLYSTLWENGGISGTTGAETGAYASGSTEHGERHGYTPDFIDLTADEIAFGGHRPEQFKVAGSEKEHGDYKGIKIFYYDAADGFISAADYQINIMPIPSNAVKFKMTGSGTEWNNDNDRFYIAISGLRIAENIKLINCRTIENRCMGVAGIFNGLTIEGWKSKRNGVPIQGNTGLSALKRDIDLEEGARLTRNVIIRDSELIDAQDGSILLWTVKDILIENCLIKGKNFYAYVMNDKIRIRGCEFHNFEKMTTLAPNTIIDNCDFYNCRISSESAPISNSRFYDCEIKDDTAGKIWTPFTENAKISFKNCDFYITDNFPRKVNGVANFITLNGSTEVAFDGCKSIDSGVEKTYITTYEPSNNAGFTNPVGGIGVTFKNCDITGLYVFQGTRIREISNSIIGFSLNFNGSITDSDVPGYSGLSISNSKFDLNKRESDTHQGILDFNLPVSIDNSTLLVKGVEFIDATSYMLKFLDKLRMHSSRVNFTSPGAVRAFEAQDATNRITGSFVEAENGTAIINIETSVNQ